MSKVQRPRIPGATIFFHVALRDPESDLLLREINLLRFAVASTLRDWPVRVEALDSFAKPNDVYLDPTPGIVTIIRQGGD